jgi:hypothetical protein
MYDWVRSCTENATRTARDRHGAGERGKRAARGTSRKRMRKPTVGHLADD